MANSSKNKSSQNKPSKSRPASIKARMESDTFGPIAVPADRYWGAQT